MAGQVVSIFGLGWRDIPDGLQKAPVVEPDADPFERGELYGFEVAPWSSPMDDLGLLRTVDRFGESIVVNVTNASDRRLDARLRQPFGIANGHVLRAAVGMMNQPATFDGPPIMHVPLKREKFFSSLRRLQVRPARQNLRCLGTT